MSRKKSNPSTLKVTSIRNSFADSILSMGMFGGQMGFAQNYGTPVHQLNTLFRNNRGNYATNQRFELNEFYAQQGIVQNIVDVPSEDALKNGIEIKTKQLDPEEIELIHYKMEEQDDFANLIEAMSWTRLFGGGGLIIVSGQNKTKLFDPTKIKKGDPLDFHPADMWELPFQKYRGSNEIIQGYGLLDAATGFNYYGDPLDKSHVLCMKGIKAPSLIRPRFLGWGVSVLEGCIDAVNQYLKAVNLLFEILDEYKIDYYKIKNFNTDIAIPNAQEALFQRLMLMNQSKNYNNAAVMDSEDDFIQKILSFTGFAEIFEQIRMQFAASVKMPMSKIFGIPATGFSSGEDDIEVYNGMVKSKVQNRMRPVLHQIVQLRIMQTFGIFVDDLQIKFHPLRTLGAEQDENVKTQKYTRVFQAVSVGRITDEEFRDACNAAELMPIQLDPNIDESELGTDEEEDSGEGGAKAKKGPKSKTTAPVAKNSDDEWIKASSLAGLWDDEWILMDPDLWKGSQEEYRKAGGRLRRKK